MRLTGVVLAAGAGSRLRPLTDERPKPLVPILGRTLLDRALDKLRQARAEHVYVNTHIGGDLVEEALRPWGDWVTSRRERHLSGPAGALRLFADDLADSDVVLVLSGDVLFDDSLNALIATHMRTNASLTFATTAVRDAGRFGVLEVDADGLLVTAHEKPEVPPDEERLVSAGMYAIRPSALEVLPNAGVLDFVTDFVPSLMSVGARIATHQIGGGWFDVGSSVALYAATLRELDNLEGAQHLAESATVEPGAVLRGRVSVEVDGWIGRDAWVQDAVLLPGAHVPAGTVLIGGLLARRGGFNTRNYGGS